MNRSMLSRRGGVVATIASIALVVSACSPGGAEPTPSGGASSDKPMEAVALTVGAVFTTAAVPLWIADEQGIFEKYALDVTITQSPNFAASAPALLNGQMQFANAATAPVITAVDQNMPIQIVAGVQAEQDDPSIGTNQVMVPKGSTVKRPKDLEGKTVATSAVGSGPYVGVMANYLADGGAKDGINWVVMSLSELLPALESGQIDAAIMSEPFTASARDAGFTAAFNAYHAKGVDAIPVGFTDAVLVASSDYLAKNAGVAERMRSAMIEANRYAQDNPDAVRALLVSRLQLDKTTSEKVNLPAFVGEVQPADIQSMVDAMLKVGLIKAEHDAADIVWLP
ncbi:ABC transporter substrate-binding protein [Luethyella okanaganae]|uniref:ABC transporter substrate-binding protein n=1 Tax=Luethyella okanaganae TaxID=69372 RepID=A0ABW1VD37_9MICO